MQEAKIDIPGVTNPRNPSPYNTQPMTYKQHVLFSDLINTVSSELLTGLDSTLTLFVPSDSPHGFAAAAPSISYKAADWVETSFAQDAGVRERSLADVKNFLSIPWFGSRTSEPSIVSFACPHDHLTDQPFVPNPQLPLMMVDLSPQFRFNFTNPLIPPTSYRGSIRLHASNFLPRGVPPPKDLLSLQDGWLTVDNVEATRMWLSWEGRSVGDTDP